MKKNIKNLNKKITLHNSNKNGITLIALIITIVIMLILATVTIGAINGGLFDYAGKAKTDTEEVSKVTGIKESYILAKGESKTGRIITEDMQNALDKVFGKDYAEALDNSGQIVVRIEDKFYDVDSNGNVGGGKKIEPIENAGDITKTGAGTEDDPFKIRCIEDLVAFSKMLQKTSNATQRLSGKYVELTRNLDFNSIFSYSNYKTTYSYNSTLVAYVPDANSETTIMELLTDLDGQGFIPIGHSAGDKGLAGTFDGKNYEILNIYINGPQEAGLFRGAYGATIKNITVSGTIKGTARCGGICSQSNATKYYNCTNKATVSGGAYGNAGIVYLDNNSNAEIKNCHNEGYVDYGISGSFGGIVNRCYNISNKVKRCGIGDGANVINCYNIGNIGIDNSRSSAGIGSGSNIRNCYNGGIITANPIKSTQYGGAARYTKWSKWWTNI